MEKKTVLALCKECCITHSALLLQGYFGAVNVPAKSDDRCVYEILRVQTQISSCVRSCV